MTQTRWNIDTTHSTVGFSVRHMVFAKVRGRFGAFQGALSLDEADLTQSSVSVEIDAASIDTGVPDRDGHLRSPDFFDAATHPKLSFTSTAVEKAGEDRYAIHGTLTIRGQSRPVVLDAEYGGRGKDPWGNARVGFHAKTSIERSAFGLTWNQTLEAGGVLVSDKIEIELDVQAVAAA